MAAFVLPAANQRGEPPSATRGAVGADHLTSIGSARMDG